MTTKDIKVLADRHTHAGREYPQGSVIKGMSAADADWLIGLGRAEEVGASAPTKTKKQEG